MKTLQTFFLKDKPTENEYNDPRKAHNNESHCCLRLVMSINQNAPIQKEKKQFYLNQRKEVSNVYPVDKPHNKEEACLYYKR